MVVMQTTFESLVAFERRWHFGGSAPGPLSHRKLPAPSLSSLLKPQNLEIHRVTSAINICVYLLPVAGIGKFRVIEWIENKHLLDSPDTAP